MGHDGCKSRRAALGWTQPQLCLSALSHALWLRYALKSHVRRCHGGSIVTTHCTLAPLPVDCVILQACALLRAIRARLAPANTIGDRRIPQAYVVAVTPQLQRDVRV